MFFSSFKETNRLLSKGMLNIHLKLQSSKLYNNKYMIASTQTTNSEIFAFIAVLVLKVIEPKSFVYKQKRR